MEVLASFHHQTAKMPSTRSMARFLWSSAPRLLYHTVCSSTAPPSPSSCLLASTFRLRHFSAGNLARAKDSMEPWFESVPVERLRNIGMSEHIFFGKTAQTNQHRIRLNRMNKDEARTRAGLESWAELGLTHCTWKDYMVNIIDIPGHVDFTIEVESALRAVDGAILVLCSVGGVQSQSIIVDRQMRRYEVPRLAFINKLDQMGANPWKVLNQARSKLQHHSAAVQVPIGLEDDFKGLVDLVHLKAYSFHGSYGPRCKTSEVEKVIAEEVPVDMEALVLEKRHELIEIVSEVDEKLAEAFLCDKPISAVDLEEAIRRATIARKFIPVFMGGAFKNKGLQPLLDGVLNYLPCPIEISKYALDQTKNEKVELPGSPNGPLVAMAFKLEIKAFKLENKQLPPLPCLRIYEGVIRRGDFITNVNTGKKTEVFGLGRMVSVGWIPWEEIQEAHAGEIVGIICDDFASGDTFTDGSVRYTMTSMNVPEPVMSLAVQPVSNDSGEQVSSFQKL